MAIYHFTSKIIGRSTRNTVAALAYRTGTELTCARTGVSSDYSEKSVEQVELLCHEDAPAWVHDLQAEISQNREAGVQHLSDICELAEKRLDAQVYRECEFALPHELSNAQNYELAREFIHDQFTKKGMLALASFHMETDAQTGQKKPHCHLLLTMREATGSGFSLHKNRDWNAKEHLFEWREAWAQHVNQYLKSKGIESTIDHRSYKDQGLDIEPQIKRGRNIQEMHNKGMVVEKMQEWDAIRIRNLYRIISKPEVILDIVTKQKAVFSMKDIQKVLFRYVDDQNLFDRLSAQIQASDSLIHLSEGKRGALYTTHEMLKIETSMLQIAKDLQGQSHSTISLSYHPELNSEQRIGLHGILNPSQLCTLIGYAGSGKSKLLSVAASIWQQNGMNVIGLAPTGKAADNLNSLGIESFTLHKFLKEYEQGRCQYNANTVLVLDEAGMVDTRRFEHYLSAVKELGVKTVLVGDAGQLQAVEAGDAFRLISQITNPHILAHVMRQKIVWQQKATQKFGALHTEEALRMYWDHGYIHLLASQKQGFSELLGSWFDSIQKNLSHTHTILAHTNAEVEELNHQARLLLKAQGLISKQEHHFHIVRLKEDDWGNIHTQRTKKAFARGDRVVFTRNDNGLGIKNGMMGTIVAIDSQSLKVQLENNDETINVTPNLYPYFDQGWATTIHKAQGSTFDHVFVWSSQGMYRNLSYVAFTRHKEALHVYADQSSFMNKEDFISKLSRASDKDSSLDHLSVEQAEQLMKQDELFLRPIFEKLQNHLEAIGFVSREAFTHTWKQFLSTTEAIAKDWGIIKDHDEQNHEKQTKAYSPSEDLVGPRGSAHFLC